jgi:hypothetical protein
MRIFTAAAVLAALGTAGAASAQTNTLNLTPVGISVRGGVVLPLDSTLENLGNSLIGLGLEYQLPRSYLPNGETYLALDYFAPRIGGDKGSVFPLTINQRWYDNPDGLRRNYFFLGLGAAFIDVTNSEVAVALRGGYGIELGDRIFTEITGYVSDKAGGARANGVGLYLGYRF